MGKDNLRILAAGGDIANTIAFYDAGIKLSEAVSDLSDLDNNKKFQENFLSFVVNGSDQSNISKNSNESNNPNLPDIIVCDKHPSYFSSNFAREYAKANKIRLLEVQHHTAHVFSAAFEQGFDDFIGIAADGLGYGDDGTIWGGEVFLAKGSNIKRVGHLERHAQVGGDSAAIFPKKMLFGIIYRFMDLSAISRLGIFTDVELRMYSKQFERNFNVFETTSTGRVLDSVSALLGVCEKRTYEGEPAIELEMFASADYYEVPLLIEEKNNILVLNTTELFRFLVSNLHKDKKKLAATAQMYLARGFLEIALRVSKINEVSPGGSLPIVFSGGVAYNKMISGYLKDRGVFLHRKFQPGDHGIAVGQIAYAQKKLLGSP